MIIGEIAFFKTEEKANAYAGIVPETKPEKTEAPETEAPETEAPAVTEKAPETEAPGPGGCASVMGVSAVAVLAAVAASVALKKKD